jgi:hypothetical protein
MSDEIGRLEIPALRQDMFDCSGFEGSNYLSNVLFT